MGTSTLHRLESWAVVGAATLLFACSGAAASSSPTAGASPEGSSAATTEVIAPANTPEASASVAPSAPLSAAAVPDAIYGDWHEDRNASAENRAVFVPRSVDLGPSLYRRTLSFGRDGSFSTLRLHPADAHYECKGTFAFVAPNKVEAKCQDPRTRSEIKFAIRILEANKDRLVVEMTP